MKKWGLLGLMLGLLLLASCGTKLTAAQPANRHKLAEAENIWHDVGSWTNGKYLAQAKSVAPTVTISHAGKFDSNQLNLTYAQVKQGMTRQATETKVKFFSLAAVNSALTQAKAGVKLHALSDLTFHRLQTDPTVNDTGYVAHGHHLYAVAVSYPAGSKPKAPTVTVYANTGHVAKRVTTVALAGRWVGSDGTQQRVIGNWLYRNDTLGASRLALRQLRTIPTAKLYTAVYLQRLALAAQHGYRLSRATTTVATDGTTLYLFMSATKMVAITANGVTAYTKTTQGQDTSKLKADIAAVFKAADADQKLLPASSVANIGSAHYEVACHAATQLTDTYSSQDIDWQKATLVNGRVTIADMYPELK